MNGKPILKSQTEKSFYEILRRISKPQRIQIARLMQLEYKKRLAKVLAGIEVVDTEAVAEEVGSYFGRVFELTD